jgi:hypothetical protein
MIGRRNNRSFSSKFSSKTPWYFTNTFFGIFFAFTISSIIVIWGIMAYSIYNVASDPSIIGRIAGEIVSGFNEKVK